MNSPKEEPSANQSQSGNVEKCVSMTALVATRSNQSHGLVPELRTPQEIREVLELVTPTITSQHKNLSFEEYIMSDKHLLEFLTDEIPEIPEPKDFNWVKSILPFIGLIGSLFHPPFAQNQNSWLFQLWQWSMVAIISSLIFDCHKAYREANAKKPKNKEQIVRAILKRCRTEK